MKKVNKLLIAVIVFVVACVAIIGYQVVFNNGNGEKKVVKIGVILPLTGDLAFIGQSAKNGAELALNEHGNTTKYKYELVFEDDELTPTKSVSALNKLVSLDKVSGVISFSGSVGQALAPVAEKSKVSHFAISSDLGAAVGDYNYINFVSPNSEADTLVSALKDKNIKRVATLSQSGNSGAQTIVDKAEAGFKANGILNTTEYFAGGDRDFRTVIEKLSATNPDIYFIMARSPEVELIVKQLRELNIQTPITGVETFGLSNQLSLFEGQWFVDPADPSGAFVEKMKAAYNNETPTSYAANVYDSVNLFISAIEKTGNGRSVPSNQDVNKNLSIITKEKHNGAVGDDIYFDNDGVLVDKAAIKEIRDGKMVYIGRK